MDGAKRKSGAGGTIESFFGAPTKRSKSGGGGNVAGAGAGAGAAPAEAGAAPAAHADAPAAAQADGGGGAGGSASADAAESSLTVRQCAAPPAKMLSRSSVTTRLRSRTRDTVTPARRWSVDVWA